MKRKGTVIVGVVLLLIAQAARAAWGTSTRLTWSAGSSENPAIAVDSSGKLHLVWQDEAPGSYEIYYRKSTDGGASWTTSQRITWNGSTSYVPAIAVDPSGKIQVVWTDEMPGNFEIYYKGSTDGGANWTASQRLTWSPGISYFPAIAVDSVGGLHVVWADYTPGNAEIYYKKSTDGGASWMPSQRLTWNSGNSRFQAIAVDTFGNPHVVWQDDTNVPNNPRIYYKKSSDGGTSWTGTKTLTWNLGGSSNPAIAVDSSANLSVVWMGSSPVGNLEIYYRKSGDGGASWATSQRLTWNSGYSGYPAIAVGSSSNLHVVWYDDTPGNVEIYYKKSTNGGAGWTTNQRLTWNSGYSGYPAIAVDSSGKLHVVWHDDTPGNKEIYYLKGT